MDLDRRLDEVGWALFLLMIGVLWLIPGRFVPEGTWLLGAAVILLGINAFRYARGLAINGFSTTLGLFALAAGAVSAAGVQAPLFPIFLVVVGAVLLVRPFFKRTGSSVIRHHTGVTP